MGRLAVVVAFAVLLATYAFAYSYSGYPPARLLPVYTLLTLARVTLVYVISILFGLILGVLAASNSFAAKVLIPLFDILQSVPILGYFPLALLALITVFPGSTGVEFASLLLLFTAMEWSIFFGVLGAVKGIPRSVSEAAGAFGVRGTAYLRHVVLPAIAPALISASTLAWNDGWTFVVAAEYVQYGGRTYSVQGLGAYLNIAANENLEAAWLGFLIVGEMVIFTNLLVWHRLADHLSQRRPLIGVMLPERLTHPIKFGRRSRRVLSLRFRHEFLHRPRFKHSLSTSLIGFVFVGVLILLGLARYVSGIFPPVNEVLRGLLVQETSLVPLYTLFTLARLFAVYILCLLISIFAAVLAATKKNFPKYFYPVYDLGRAIPYLTLFPPLFATLNRNLPGELSLQISSFVLIFLGMFWYILFNVVTAATYLPNELNELSSLFGIKGWRKAKDIVFPAILPAVITGSILAWGGGWNVVIYSEYVQQGANIYSLPGLGALLDKAAYVLNDTVLVVLLLFVMSGIVILMGRLVWRRLLHKIEKYGVELT